MAGAVLVTYLAFRFLSARLGLASTGVGEYGRYTFLFVPAGAVWGLVAGSAALWLSVGLSQWVRSRGLVSQEAGTDTLASIGAVVVGVVSFVAGAVGFAFVLQLLVN